MHLSNTWFFNQNEYIGNKFFNDKDARRGDVYKSKLIPTRIGTRKKRGIFLKVASESMEFVELDLRRFNMIEIGKNGAGGQF